MYDIYNYPDPTDKITCALIDNHEPYKGYWADSERKILDLMKRLIKKHLGTRRGSLLDAGCGNGRLLKSFSPYFNRILAIDPDYDRLSLARTFVEKEGLSQKVILKDIPIEALDEREKFDVIICSHVIQHVNTSNISKILSKFGNILAEEGLLLITTTHSTIGEDFFVKDFLEDSKFVEEYITEEDFNSLVTKVGQLPIHFFYRGTIEQALMHHGFKIIDFKVFHILQRDLSISFGSDVDNKVNSNSILQLKSGRDMFIAAKRL